MNRTLFILCGPAGVGKSTWVRKQVENCPYDCNVVSRDEIRFSLVKENEDYFSKEDLVFKTFLDEIGKSVAEHTVTFADATHLNPKARNKVLNTIDTENIDIIPVNFMLSLETCLTQNAQRTGRKRVPSTVIEKMWWDFVPAGPEEKYEYARIINIKEE